MWWLGELRWLYSTCWVTITMNSFLSLQPTAHNQCLEVIDKGDLYNGPRHTLELYICPKSVLYSFVMSLESHNCLDIEVYSESCPISIIVISLLIVIFQPAKDTQWTEKSPAEGSMCTWTPIATDTMLSIAIKFSMAAMTISLPFFYCIHPSIFNIPLSWVCALCTTILINWRTCFDVRLEYE